MSVRVFSYPASYATHVTGNLATTLAEIATDQKRRAAGATPRVADAFINPAANPAERVYVFVVSAPTEEAAKDVKRLLEAMNPPARKRAG
jgi:hypothetical protein